MTYQRKDEVESTTPRELQRAGWDDDDLSITLPPSEKPSESPTFRPSLSPSMKPSLSPSIEPTKAPSIIPSEKPSHLPSIAPSNTPSHSPSYEPTEIPSFLPSDAPTNIPSFSPSDVPTKTPSQRPSSDPSKEPSKIPSQRPSLSPSSIPSLSNNPSSKPSRVPSLAPSTVYGLSKIQLTTILIKVYSSESIVLEQESMNHFRQITMSHVNEFMDVKLQSLPSNSFDEIILPPLFIRTKLEYSSDVSNSCPSSSGSSSGLYCFSVHFSSETELLAIDSLNAAQESNYRYLFIQYLLQAFDDENNANIFKNSKNNSNKKKDISSTSNEKTPREIYIERLQNSTELPMSSVHNIEATGSELGSNPFLSPNIIIDTGQTQYFKAITVQDMIQSPMWVFLFGSLFILAGGLYMTIKAYWTIRRNALLKLHLHNTGGLVGDKYSGEEEARVTSEERNP